MGKTAIIIGAGPAGLTAAYELLERTDITPVVLEKSGEVGGISQTVHYKGNRMDIGGHRFFTKVGRVLAWWLSIVPLEKGAIAPDGTVSTGPDPEREDLVMLVRTRMSRILFLGQLFDYPISLTPATLRKLGIAKAFRMGLSYLKSLLFPIREVKNIEQLMINRFGFELYSTFFKSYTEKVWGAPPDQIGAEWGEQRLKDMSIGKAIINALLRSFRRKSDLRQKNTSTSLIERFLYPKYGPGQMWEEVARIVGEKGGKVCLGQRVAALHAAPANREIGAPGGNQIASVTVVDESSGETRILEGDYFFSTMPVKELIAALDCPAPDDVRRIANALLYRDFMAAGVLTKKLKIKNDTNISTPNGVIPDTWIYIQEPNVKLGRLQIFNNWNRYMVKDPDNTVWLSLEYFCNEGDNLWNMEDGAFLTFAVDELAKIGIIDKVDVLDRFVLRMKKTYPAYIGTYGEFDVVRRYTDSFENLFLIGRNGMHRYNNQDHSMLTAMTAVDNIIAGIADKSNIWDVNTEQKYNEET